MLCNNESCRHCKKTDSSRSWKFIHIDLSTRVYTQFVFHVGSWWPPGAGHLEVRDSTSAIREPTRRGQDVVECQCAGMTMTSWFLWRFVLLSLLYRMISGSEVHRCGRTH